MDKKKLITGIILIVLGVSLLLIFSFTPNEEQNEKCRMFTGGSFNVNFETNGGESIETMTVCIACSPDSYSELPVPEKEGYVFENWYYDKKLTNIVDAQTTLNISPVAKYDEKGCQIGYEDITLYAKYVVE